MKMDSKKILPIFFFVFIVILSNRQSHARAPKSGFTESPSSAPSPSPAPAPNSNEECCRNMTLTACIDPSSIGSKKWLVSLKNDGEELLTVNITCFPPGKLIIKKQGIPVAEHKVKEVNISANLGVNSSIQVDAGNLRCVIRIRSPVSQGGIFDYVPSGVYMTPTVGVYFLVLSGLIFGSTWAYYRWVKSGQHGDGISYQQLEMGRRPDSPSANNVETAQGWEQDWDGDWDELKLKATKGSSANGLTSRTSKRDDHDD